MKARSLHFLGKLGSLGSSENRPIMFGETEFSDHIQCLTEHIKSSFALRLSCPDSSSATSHSCSRAYSLHCCSYYFPCSLLSLFALISWLKLNRSLPLSFSSFSVSCCSFSSCAWHGLGELALWTHERCCTLYCLWA